MISSRSISSDLNLYDESTSTTVGISDPVSVNVESCFGSQPTWMVLFPSRPNAAERLDENVLFPIPPLP